MSRVLLKFLNQNVSKKQDIYVFKRYTSVSFKPLFTLLFDFN